MRYGVAVAAVVVATAVKIALDPVLGQDNPFVLLFSAVVVSGWFGGMGPAVTATIASALVAAYYFLPPDFSLRIAAPGDRLRLVTFILEATLIGLLSAALESARRRAETLKDSLQADVVERTRQYEDSEIRRRAAEELARAARTLTCQRGSCRASGTCCAFARRDSGCSSPTARCWRSALPAARRVTRGPATSPRRVTEPRLA